MKRTPLKRKAKLRRKKPMAKVSSKQKGRLAEYYRKRDEYMATHPFCEMHLMAGLKFPAQDLHHKRGRGKYLCDERYFSSLCRLCHDTIHNNPSWARKTGWLISKLQKD